MDVKLLQALQSCEAGFHLLPLPKAGQRAEGQTTPLGGGQQHGGKGVGAPKDGICAAEETASLRTLRKRTTTRRSDGVTPVDAGAALHDCLVIEIFAGLDGWPHV